MLCVRHRASVIDGQPYRASNFAYVCRKICIPLCSKPLRFIHLTRYSYSPLRLYLSPREFTKSKSALCFSLARIYRITLRVTDSGSGNTAYLPFFKRRNIIALSASTTSATVRLRSVSDRIPVVISNSAIISALPFVLAVSIRLTSSSVNVGFILHPERRQISR